MSLADQAAALGDSIGPNDYEESNRAWAMAGRFREKALAERLLKQAENTE